MKLKEVRIRKFMSMASLAEQAHLSLATIRDVEAGRHSPSLTTCQKLGDALQTSPEQIDECRQAMENALRKMEVGTTSPSEVTSAPNIAPHRARVSLRQIAKELGVSHTLLVLWRQGKRTLAPDLEHRYHEVVTRNGYS